MRIGGFWAVGAGWEDKSGWVEAKGDWVAACCCCLRRLAASWKHLRTKSLDKPQTEKAETGDGTYLPLVPLPDQVLVALEDAAVLGSKQVLKWVLSGDPRRRHHHQVGRLTLDLQLLNLVVMLLGLVPLYRQSSPFILLPQLGLVEQLLDCLLGLQDGQVLLLGHIQDVVMGVARGVARRNKRSWFEFGSVGVVGVGKPVAPLGHKEPRAPRAPAKSPAKVEAVQLAKLSSELGVSPAGVPPALLLLPDVLDDQGMGNPTALWFPDTGPKAVSVGEVQLKDDCNEPREAVLVLLVSQLGHLVPAQRLAWWHLCQVDGWVC